MVTIFGQDISLGGGIDIGGFLSSSWIYVFIVAILGFVLIVAVAIVLFFTTYKRKIEFYENVAGTGFRRIAIKRARVVKLGSGGQEVLKPMGVDYLTAYGRKIGKNTYAFAKGPDGNWYNIIHGDLDTKRGILDIEPIDRNVSIFRVALDRLTQQNYGTKPSFLQKYGSLFIILVAILILLVGFYIIAGQINEGLTQQARGMELLVQYFEAQSQDAAQNSGLVDATGDAT